MGADPTELELEDARILEEAEIMLHLGIKYHLKRAYENLHKQYWWYTPEFIEFLKDHFKTSVSKWQVLTLFLGQYL